MVLRLPNLMLACGAALLASAMPAAPGSARLAPPSGQTSRPTRWATTQDDNEQRVRVAAILAEVEDDQEHSITSAVRELSGLGGAAHPLLFLIATEDRVPATDGSRLTVMQRRALLEALGHPDPEELLASLAMAVREVNTTSARVVAFDLVAIHGDDRGVPILFEVAAIDGIGPWTRSSGGEAFESALGSLLARSNRAFDSLPSPLSLLDDEVLASTLRGIGGSRSARGISILIDGMKQEKRATGVFLSELGKLAPYASPTQDELLRQTLRSALAHEHEGVCKSAAVTLGRLEDTRAVPGLILLLDSGSPGLRRTAHWSLRRITNLSLRPDFLRWEAWYDEEVTWLDTRSGRLIEDLLSEDNAVVAAAARELALHPMHRDRFAPEITVLFDCESPSLRALACDCLAQLGSDLVLDELVEVLAYDLETVHVRAWAALKAITGFDLPAEADTWERALQDRDGPER